MSIENSPDVEKILRLMMRISGISTQKDLGVIWGISGSAVSNWIERGEIPPRRLNEFCKEHNITVEKLRGETPEPTKGLSISTEKGYTLSQVKILLDIIEDLREKIKELEKPWDGAERRKKEG